MAPQGTVSGMVAKSFDECGIEMALGVFKVNSIPILDAASKSKRTNLCSLRPKVLWPMILATRLIGHVLRAGAAVIRCYRSQCDERGCSQYHAD